MFVKTKILCFNWNYSTFVQDSYEIILVWIKKYLTLQLNNSTAQYSTSAIPYNVKV